MSLLVPLQFEEDVLLAREVEEEGSVRNARGSHDRVHIGACHTHALELGDRRVETAPARPAPGSSCPAPPPMPPRLNSAPAASRRRCRAWSRRVSRADGLTCGVMVC